MALTNTGNTGSVQAGHTEFGPFQRTAVHRNSSRPIFDHRFFFDIQPDDERRIQLAVWHRDRECRYVVEQAIATIAYSYTVVILSNPLWARVATAVVDC